MRKKHVPYKRSPLPVKPLACSLCHYSTDLGRNDLQLHLDREHKGWAEGVIRKMDTHLSGEPEVESRNKRRSS